MSPDAETHRHDLLATIAVLESQRALLGNAVVDAALAPLRRQIAARGAAQTAAAQPQVRQVTVLFLDIVGSTTLSQRLDPEETAEIMDGALAQFTTVVQQAGGRVLQYAGDSLLAAFGAEAAHEDDAERAVHAGLALLEVGRERAEQIVRQHPGSAFGVRVGLHTGPVLLGGGVNAEGTIRGLTVNVAARMEQTAPAGGLRISHDTWRQVRGLFDVLPQDPIEVKGVDPPMQTYLVQAARPRAFRVPTRGIDGVEVAMVGRDAELAQLHSAFAALAERRRAAAITLVADAGLGKSRLIAEFRSALELHPRHPQWLLARAQPHTQGQPYGLLRDLLAWRLMIADSDSAEVARRKLVQGLAPLFADEGQRPAQLLGRLIGLDFVDSPLLADLQGSGSALRQQAFSAGREVLHRMSSDGGEPLVVLVEDLHWADDGSLDFLEAMLRPGPAGEAAPALLLVMATRPALFERRSDWGAALPAHLRLDLAALTATDSQTLGHSLLGRLSGDAESVRTLRERVISDAEGNPFYMEELIKMLVDDGVIQVGEALWEVQTERWSGAQVPRTLTGVLQARLDALQGAERQALQAASVIGHVFWDDALEALRPGAAALLPPLLKKQLIVRRDGSAFEGSVEFAFHHHLLHQVTCETVLKAPRRAGHAAAAAWLVQRLGDRGGESLAVAADHFERAGDDAQALAFFERAAQSAEDRSAPTAVLAHVARALSSPALNDLQRRLALVRMQVQSADWLGRRDLQEAGLVEAQALATRLGDDAVRARLLIDRSLLADRRGDVLAADQLARQAWAAAEACGNANTATLALGMVAWGHHLRREFGEAARFAALGLESSLRLGAGSMYPVQLLLVGTEIALESGDMQHAVVCLSEAHERALELPRNTRLLGSVLIAGANVAFACNHFARAQSRARAALAHARQHGLPMLEANGLAMLCDCARELGELAVALEHGEQALAVYQRIDALHQVAKVHLALGRTRLLGPQVAAARSDFDAALSLIVDHGMPVDVAEARGWWARAALLSGELAVALPVIELLLATGLPAAPPVSLLLNLHLVLQAAADPRASGFLDSAHATLQAHAQGLLDESGRHQLLQGSAVHREVLAAWAAAHAGEPPG